MSFFLFFDIFLLSFSLVVFDAESNQADMMKRQEKDHFRYTETRLSASPFHRAVFWETQFISGLGTMAGVQPPPLRSLDDFLLSSARFAVPDVRDLDRWNNRMINNLLYYQSNYFLSALSFLLLVGYFQPIQMFVGMMVVTALFLGFVWAAENKAPIRRFRRNHPLMAVLAILLASYLFILVLGGVAVFLFGIASPVLMVLVHSSMRLRNLKNKLENKLESIGLKRTPMGLLLEALGQEQEAGS